MTTETPSALDTQVGGGHYKSMPIQPMHFSMANGMDACQHTAIKYVARFRDKGGIEDLEKAKHVIDMLIEFERKGIRAPALAGKQETGSSGELTNSNPQETVNIHRSMLTGKRYEKDNNATPVDKVEPWAWPYPVPDRHFWPNFHPPMPAPDQDPYWLVVICGAIQEPTL